MAGAHCRAQPCGLIISGGEPTLQAPYVAALFREVKRRFGMHTALDSSGFCDPAHAAELLDATDLVLLDLKTMDRAGHEKLTSQPNDRILKFAGHLRDIGKIRLGAARRRPRRDERAGGGRRTRKAAYGGRERHPMGAIEYGVAPDGHVFQLVRRALLEHESLLSRIRPIEAALVSMHRYPA